MKATRNETVSVTLELREFEAREVLALLEWANGSRKHDSINDQLFHAITDALTPEKDSETECAVEEEDVIERCLSEVIIDEPTPDNMNRIRFPTYCLLPKGHTNRFHESVNYGWNPGVKQLTINADRSIYEAR